MELFIVSPQKLLFGIKISEEVSIPYSKSASMLLGHLTYPPLIFL